MKVPRPFQQTAINRFKSFPYQLVADACGLGKTLTGIESVKYTEKLGDRNLVICPPSITEQWRYSIAEQCPSNSVGLSNYVPYDFKAYNGWVVTSYYELFKPYMMNALTSVVWDCIIIDEAHRIRNHTAQITNLVHKLPKSKAVALTATPMEHGPKDLWSILHFLNPDKFPTYWGFVNLNLIVEEGLYTKWDIKGPKDPEAFAKLVAPYMIQRTKEEVMPELPERIIIEQRVPLQEKQEKWYKELKAADDIVARVGDQEMLIKNALAKLIRLQQISTNPWLLGLGEVSGKMQWVNEFVEDHPNDRVVFFSRFRLVAETLATRYNGALIVGGVNQVDLFKSGEKQNASCVIADSLQGVDGLQAAQHAIFVDGHWSATQMTQALDRIHRMDIKEAKNIYLLSSTWEDRLVYKAVDEKWTEQQLVYAFIKELQGE